jgi:hypothetical protein
VNGSQGIAYDIGWATGADVGCDPPLVVMVCFDGHDVTVFSDENEELRDSNDQKVIPILRDNQECVLGSTQYSCARFPHTVAYTVTVHTAQGITLKRTVTRFYCRNSLQASTALHCQRLLR